jgi:hypothetical protein
MGRPPEWNGVHTVRARCSARAACLSTNAKCMSANPTLKPTLSRSTGLTCLDDSIVTLLSPTEPRVSALHTAPADGACFLLRPLRLRDGLALGFAVEPAVPAAVARQAHIDQVGDRKRARECQAYSDELHSTGPGGPRSRHPMHRTSAQCLRNRAAQHHCGSA